MMNELKTFQVIPLLEKRGEDMANYAHKLLDAGIGTHIAAIMTLVPESNPPYPKAKVLGERFEKFRKTIGSTKKNVGILLQATMGHGWIPDEKCNFQTLIRTDGTTKYQMCPLDKGFQEYIRSSVAILAKLKPAFFMVDDDFRLFTSRGGCFCPLHLAAFSKKMGKNYTRESLLEAFKGDPKLSDLYVDFQQDTLNNLAQIIRDEIDKIDPEIPGYFCTCSCEVAFANKTAEILSAKNQKPIIRINNACYLSSSLREFPKRMYTSVVQIAACNSNAIVLDESDTCPQNRYSTNAGIMHSHYTSGIFDGCSGAKHWITRTSELELESGKAYFDILLKYHDFYEELFKAVENLKLEGIASSALPEKPYFGKLPNIGLDASCKVWSGFVVGKMGLPCNIIKKPAGPVMMTGGEVVQFSDEELKQFLSQGMILSGDAAIKLQERGFGEYLGVEAKEWTKEKVSGELWGDQDLFIRPSPRYVELLLTSNKAEIKSTLIHRSNGCDADAKKVGAGTVYFENSLKGKIVIFAALIAEGGFDIFSFLNEIRKNQLIEAMEFVCGRPLDFYYPGDAEVYLKYGTNAKNEKIVFVLNLGLDLLENAPLICGSELWKVEKLSSDGLWQPIPFDKKNLAVTLIPATPVILKVKTKE